MLVLALDGAVLSKNQRAAERLQLCTPEQLTQLRWTAERLNSLIEREINHRVRMPHLQSNGDPGERLMMAYRLCLAERVFLLLTKQQLDTVKAINPLAARVEKWVGNQAPKPPKPPKTPIKPKLTRLKDEQQDQ